MPTDVVVLRRASAPEMAADGQLADLVLGNNVLAQVPDLNDFVAGIPTILKPGGTVTIEFPHLMRLLEENQFDTIYHEHFCYFSLISAEAIFAGHGMTIFDVEELWTHGGSLRIYARHAADDEPAGQRAGHRAARARGGGRLPRRRDLHRASRSRSGRPSARCSSCSSRSSATARRSSATALPARATRCSTTAASAPTSSTSPSTATRTSRAASCPARTSRSIAPERIDEVRPDYIFILPWNFKDEILAQLAHAREWGAQFIVPIPDATVRLTCCRLSLGTATDAPASTALPRRPQRRHRDRLRRHDPAPARRASRIARCTGWCLSADERARGRGAGERRSLPRRCRRVHRRRRSASGRATSRTSAPSIKDYFSELRRDASSPTSCCAPIATTSTRTTARSPSWRGTRSATTSSPSTRSPSTRATSASRTCSCRSPARVAERKVELLLRALRLAARQALVPSRDVLRPDGAARRRVQRATACGRGVPRAQAGDVTSEMRRRTREST